MSWNEMIEQIPYELRRSPQYQAIFKAQGKFIDTITAQIDDLLEQTYIDGATWALEMLEKEMGIEIDTSKSGSERRSVIRSKRRGVGTVTAELVKSVAEAYYGGEVEVYENFDSYIIQVKFISRVGIPSNLDDVEQSLREVIPAHLGIGFLYSYLLIRDIHNTMTIGELQQQTLGSFAGRNN